METAKTVPNGFDGTVCNKGSKGSAIGLLENKFLRPFQWLSCLSHFHELPKRHLFANLDGHMTGSGSYCGEIAKSLATCELLPIAKLSAN